MQTNETIKTMMSFDSSKLRKKCKAAGVTFSTAGKLIGISPSYFYSAEKQGAKAGKKPACRRTFFYKFDACLNNILVELSLSTPNTSEKEQKRIALETANEIISTGCAEQLEFKFSDGKRLKIKSDEKRDFQKITNEALDLLEKYDFDVIDLAYTLGQKKKEIEK